MIAIAQATYSPRPKGYAMVIETCEEDKSMESKFYILTPDDCGGVKVELTKFYLIQFEPQGQFCKIVPLKEVKV